MSPKPQKPSRRRRPIKREPVLRTPPAEELLEELLAERPYTGDLEPTVLCTTLGRGQLALALAGQIENAHITCCAFDLFLADEMQSFLDRHWIDDDEEDDTDAVSHHKINVLCATDFPEVAADLVVIPVKKTGDAELTRDWLQSGVQRLKIGGELWAAVDHPRDHWLHEELKKLFPKVTRLPEKRGVVYTATKTAELKKMKNFQAEFAFRDGERMIHGVSRPGVFSHRRVDGGARALIDVMQIAPGDRVADIGCGSGTVGIAAALRHPDVSVLAIDSNPRALECTQKSAELNGVTTITTLLDANATCEPRSSFDVVVGNPPYYSNYRIAEIFLSGAYRALRPGGKAWMVTKQPTWFVERMSQLFDDVQMMASKGYKVIVGTKRGE